jgi:hypothetical protein
MKGIISRETAVVAKKLTTRKAEAVVSWRAAEAMGGRDREARKGSYQGMPSMPITAIQKAGSSIFEARAGSGQSRFKKTSVRHG